MDIKTRDFFAAKAMQVLLTKFNPEKNYTIAAIAKDSYAVADAMILESSK
jgi:hypothetical protein